MTTLYIFTTVFGLGILLVDFIMVISGSGEADENQADDFDVDMDQIDTGEANSDDVMEATRQSLEESKVGPHRESKKGGFLLRTLGAFRNLIYFSVGFGPTGLFATWVGENSLLWAIGVGIVVMFIARVFRSFQSDKLDSTISSSELLLERGKVIVSIPPGKIGKVRISHGGMQIDRYAKAKNEMDAFQKGDTIQVHEVLDDLVIIEHTI